MAFIWCYPLLIINFKLYKMKEKLKYIPFHLLTAIPIFMFIFITMTEAFSLSDWEGFLAGIIVYVYDVTIHAKFDYLEDKVKKLEKDYSNKG